MNLCHSVNTCHKCSEKRTLKNNKKEMIISSWAEVESNTRKKDKCGSRIGTKGGDAQSNFYANVCLHILCLKQKLANSVH